MLGRWRRFLGKLARDTLVAWMALRDSRVPWSAKLVSLASIAYLVSPLDFIPDVIPVIGWLDDLAMLPLAAHIASRLIPFDVLDDLRARADRAVLRHGPRAVAAAVLALLLWIAFAGVGGWLWLRANRAEPGTAGAAPATSVER